jgi:CubicO group peptidase (beta-lactamase class C family)
MTSSSPAPSSASTADDLPAVLGRIDDWPPERVAVGVTAAHDTLATHGPADELLPLASVTKPLAAYAVLLAVQDGALHLDEPLGHGEVAPDATVRHLLAHASGLPPDPGGPIVVPGRKRIYSNWGFDLLGELVAERVGRPFAQHLALEVLEPLGMQATRLEGSPAYAGHGTVTDLLAFARELLDPQLLDLSLLAEATAVAFPGLDGVLPGFGRQSPNDWGLGFELKADKQPHWTGATLAPETFGHFGRSGSFLWVDPTRQLACVELADRSFGPWAAEAWPGFSDAVVAAACGEAGSATERSQGATHRGEA